MEKVNKYRLPTNFSQNNILPIRVVSPAFGHLSEEASENYGSSQRLSYYFFLLVLEGSCRYRVDGEKITVGKNEMLFSLPNQFQDFPENAHGLDYYKLGFDDECLYRLPGKFPFLLNPLSQQKISFLPGAANRLRAIFQILTDLLRTTDGDPDLVLAYLNSLLTEINSAYFRSQKRPAGGEIDKFIEFKVFVESNFASQPAITTIAEKLALGDDSLYRIVKKHSGLSPKEFMTQRLMLEATRRIHYGQNISVKELAYELGFNDPGYFSRLFKKATGKTVAAFYQDLS
ncbi:AraC family transcriptional regulator [Dyadobacter sp. BHUBP1]|uniref:AraC family transcriptional regulator n=1 Tax=Dyadobacter sp. BHUBP1 TaxID=3424178 RepID=UPI003D357D3E